MALLSGRALDINVSEDDFCLILGYLASPDRIGLIEAQIPEEKSFIFEREFPGAPYFPIKQGMTTGGNLMKQGCQLRIYFNNIDNCPKVLLPFLGVGVGRHVKRINKGKFVEKVVKHYGFRFGPQQQNARAVRQAIVKHHPTKTHLFDQGLQL